MMKSFATKGCVHGMTVQKQRGDMQTRILAYIEQEIKTRGYAPSVREIGEAVGLKSTSTVHGHLIRLQKKRLLHRNDKKPQAMKIYFSGIMNDDYIVVHKQPDANNGEIVVALIEDEATVKRFYKENGHIRLQPENDTMEPIIVPTVMILGKVVSLNRKF